MLEDELGFEAALTVTGYSDGQFAEFALERLAALTVAGVADWFGHAIDEIPSAYRARSGTALVSCLSKPCSTIRSSGFW